jgi:quercetin dioxygenase-like cupin family protein
MSVSMGEEIRIGQLAIRFLVEGSESGGAVAIFEFDVPVGARIPVAHSHDGYEETVYGVRGTLSWTVEGSATEVGPGEALLIPRGVVHNFANNQDVDATALAIVTPGVLGPEYFRELAEAVSPGAPPDFAAIAAVMQKHGLTPAP